MTYMVLIVEDDHATFQLLDSLLADDSYHVLYAANGVEAMQMARQAQPDLILLDLRLPRQDGWITAEQLSNGSTTAHIPIIAISVMIEPTDDVRALDAGCVEYISKPFDVRRLRDRINFHLGSSSAQA